jgi:hypothetical protein
LKIQAEIAEIESETEALRSETWKLRAGNAKLLLIWVDTSFPMSGLRRCGTPVVNRCASSRSSCWSHPEFPGLQSQLAEFWAGEWGMSKLNTFRPWNPEHALLLPPSPVE